MRKMLRMVVATLGLLVFLLSVSGAAVAAEQAYVVNGMNLRCSDFSSAHNECWSYVAKFYRKIWGENINSNFYENNILREKSKQELTLTPEHLAEYVSMAQPGAVLRVCNAGCLYGSDYMGHSLLIVSIQDDGFTTFEGGLSASPHYREHFYTWEEFCRTGWLGGRYGYIKYIKLPAWVTGQEPVQKPEQTPVQKPEQAPAQEPEPEPPTLVLLEDPLPIDGAAIEPGDLNRNGRLDAADYVLLRRVVAGTIRLGASQLSCGDLNGDGTIDGTDAVLLKVRSSCGEGLLSVSSATEFVGVLLGSMF